MIDVASLLRNRHVALYIDLVKSGMKSGEAFKQATEILNKEKQEMDASYQARETD